MNREELTSLLSDLAENDLVQGADIYDHPCTVAIRAIDKCFDDIKSLRPSARMNYSPEW